MFEASWEQKKTLGKFPRESALLFSNPKAWREKNQPMSVSESSLYSSELQADCYFFNHAGHEFCGENFFFLLTPSF